MDAKTVREMSKGVYHFTYLTNVHMREKGKFVKWNVKDENEEGTDT